MVRAALEDRVVGFRSGIRTLTAGGAVAGAVLAPPVDFDRQIRPILSEHCYACHGPDAQARKADLRLDVRADAVRVRPDGAAIVPLDPAKSELCRRIATDRPEDLMPPPSFKKPLSAEEAALLRRWVEEGAQYARHWAFEPPAAPALPPDAAGREIDTIVRARLAAEGMELSPPADRETLLRRVTLDLTGLPPAPEEIDAFLADPAPSAYEHVVDRLLASPRYGEAMAVDWLDASRYADTHGYHGDNERPMWRWRDWVIAAFNGNQPFDRFVVEQLAGDLLPQPTLQQRVATGFNRNHCISWEGGIIEEEYRCEYVADRVNTYGTVFLGLTVGCARCHDHKYDPITLKEYYQLSAFFDQIPEKGSDGLQGNAVPFLNTPLPEQEAALREVQEHLASLERERAAPDSALDAAQVAWEQETRARLGRRWTPLHPVAAAASGGVLLAVQPDHSVLASGPNPETGTYEFTFVDPAGRADALRVEVLTDPSLPDNGPGRSSHRNVVLSNVTVSTAPISDPAASAPWQWRMAVADHEQPGFPAIRAIDADGRSGWAIGGGEGAPHELVLIPAPAAAPADGGVVMKVTLAFESPFPQHGFGRVRISAGHGPDMKAAISPAAMGAWEMSGPHARGGPGSASAGGVPTEAAEGAWRSADGLSDGQPFMLEGEHQTWYFRRTIASDRRRRLTLAFGSDDMLTVWLDGRQVHDVPNPRTVVADQDLLTLDLEPGEHVLTARVQNLAGPAAFYARVAADLGVEAPYAVATALETDAAARPAAATALLRDFFRRSHSQRYRQLLDEFSAAETRRRSVMASVPTTMVMESLPAPRDTFMLMRGQYDRRGERVSPATPSSLPEMDQSLPRTRLGLAEWTVSPRNPLTARVAVNRFWQHCFGAGLVRTAEDFGVQGERPDHQALLDWLAVDFVGSGWDVKRLMKTIVMSDVYRQRSVVTPRLLERDPENRLLTRGPRFRLSAEQIRDLALAASGLLVERQGGPSVRPYHPPGIYELIINPFGTSDARSYVQDHGDKLYRRTMYTFWKRTVPPPSLATFDAPSREYCTVRRMRTNTPLQSLVLMNDPTYVEAARVMATRVLLPAVVAPETDSERIARLFRLATGRAPSADESRILLEFVRAEQAAFEREPARAASLVAVGETPPPPDLDRARLAAWTSLASVILNLDETVTKG
ncbi:MAG: PSD1 and planctomycete cytochrome C domain-containing protein [Phycisphaerales bacterium]